VEIVFDFTRQDEPGRASREQERLEQLLGCFQTWIGHELPNQLVPIQAFARLLLESWGGRLDEEGREILDRLAALARKADALARRLAEVGRLLREPPWGVDLPLGDLVREAVAEATLLAAHPGVRYDIQDNLPTTRASRRLLHEVLVQLVRNATQAQAGQPGVVAIGGAREAGGVLVQVRDAGRGLAESQAGLFEPFAAGRFPGAAGAGLGLFLVRQAAARWGGVLRVRSELGRGSTFSLFLPDPA
jgi:signal transduction histidine kinase